jgi:hypothetical protein
MCHPFRADEAHPAAGRMRFLVEVRLLAHLAPIEVQWHEKGGGGREAYSRTMTCR